MSVVVCTPDIYYPVKSPYCKFIVVIRYITGKVGRIAVSAYKHFILFVAVLGSLVPHGAVLFVKQTFFP